MQRRSNVIVILGLAVFVVGAVATYFLVRDGGGGSDSAPAVANGVQVLYATDNIPAGTSGANALSAGLVKAKTINPLTKPANALTDPSQLSGRTSPGGVPSGSILTDDGFPLTQTRLGTVKIPDGMTALAVQLANVPGVAGYAGAGDKIDVFAVSKDDGGKAVSKLIMQGTEVLSVNGANLTTNPGAPGAGDLVYLLAVTPNQAEQLVYLTSNEKLYFSLVPHDQAPSADTPGVDAKSALATL